MTRLVYCEKLKKEAEGLSEAPMPGPLGEKIYQQISKEAWESWLNQQTMLINEYRLSLIDAKSRTFLREELEKFLFGPGSAAPSGYQPPQQ